MPVAWKIETANKSNNLNESITLWGIKSDAYIDKSVGIYAIISVIAYVEDYLQAYMRGILRIDRDNEK